MTLPVHYKTPSGNFLFVALKYAYVEAIAGSPITLSDVQDLFKRIFAIKNCHNPMSIGHIYTSACGGEEVQSNVQEMLKWLLKGRCYLQNLLESARPCIAIAEIIMLTFRELAKLVKKKVSDYVFHAKVWRDNTNRSCQLDQCNYDWPVLIINGKDKIIAVWP